jgi:sugar phosphate isomerase/epimerase
MKIGIDSYCFHRFFGEVYPGQPAPASPMTIDDFLDFAAESRVDGVSLETCFFPSMERSWFANLKAKLDDLGLERVYAWGHPTGLEDGTNRRPYDDMVAQIANAALVGAAVMRVTPGPGAKNFRIEPRQPRLDVLARWYKEASLVAAHHDVRLAAENHGDYTADEMLWLVEAVDSPYFGVTFDTGNFVRVLDDPVRAMEKLAKYVFATHIKDVRLREGASPADWTFFSCTAVGDGLVDMPQVIRLLGLSGYDGLLAVEIDSPHPDIGYDEHAAVRRSVDYLRGIAGDAPR